jgi:predicted lipoprotein
MSWTSIPHAHEYWRSQRTAQSRPEDVDAVEAFILTAPTATMQDAACVLDIICANYGDTRCDGLDVSALARVRNLLVTTD